MYVFLDYILRLTRKKGGFCILWHMGEKKFLGVLQSTDGILV